MNIILGIHFIKLSCNKFLINRTIFGERYFKMLYIALMPLFVESSSPSPAHRFCY